MEPLEDVLPPKPTLAGGLHKIGHGITTFATGCAELIEIVGPIVVPVISGARTALTARRARGLR
jgi:hypothetical protein